MIKLYDHPLSGHCHRARAFLKLMGLEFEVILVDLAAGDHRHPQFIKLNPLGEVPVFVDGEVTLRDSAAILTYLALKYDSGRMWLPRDPVLAAEIQAWLITSAKEVFAGPFTARLIKLFNFELDYDTAKVKSEALLGDVFEPHLADRDWLVGSHPTLADIANYSYIATAPEGEIDLDPYPNVIRWLRRVEAIEDFEPMPKAADVMTKGAV